MVGLDPFAIKMVKQLFGELAAQGTTIFMSTHTLQVAQDVCDRIGVIHKGQLIAQGTVKELQHLARGRPGGSGTGFYDSHRRWKRNLKIEE